MNSRSLLLLSGSLSEADVKLGADWGGGVAKPSRLSCHPIVTCYNRLLFDKLQNYSFDIVARNKLYNLLSDIVRLRPCYMAKHFHHIFIRYQNY